MSKTILVAVTNDLNQDQRMHRICETLSSAGNTVVFLGRAKVKSPELLDLPFEQKRMNCFFQKGFLFYLEYNVRLFLHLIRTKPDVVYAVDLDTLLGAGLATKWNRKKIIHDAHEYFVEVPELEGQSFKKNIWNWIGKRFIPQCDLCITVNEELSEILSKLYRNTFHVVQSVPRLSISSQAEYMNHQVPIILYQGVLNKGRGLEEAILAISQSTEKVEFRIAGEGDLSKDLRNLVSELDCGSKVKFLGWLTPQELKQETSKAYIGLNLLSSDSLNYKYSLANKFFDYMFAGVPSINMDFPVYHRICEKYPVGLCISDLTVDSIQDAIQQLLSNKDLYQRTQEACTEAKKIYNWEKESQSLLKLVNQHV